MSKIKVLHVIKSLGRGGAEMLLPETLALHDKAKFEFHYIYFLPWKDQMVSAITANGGIVTCLPANHNIQLMWRARKLANYCRENGIQLIHAHLPWAGILARIVGKISNIPIIYTEHNIQERYHFITRIMNLYTMNWLSRIIAVSGDVAQSIQKHKSNLKVPVQIILNGVNSDHFAPGVFDGKKIRTELNIPEDAPLIGTVAVFRFQKRLDLWMDVAKKILDQLPDAHFIMVGDGPLRESLIEKRKKVQLEHRVHLVGLKAEVRPYLAAFDVYMMSSIFEGLPIALLEAMACACPVVSTDAGGIKEVIRHGKDGLLCSVDHPEQLVQYVVDLFANEKKRRLFGYQSRQRIKEMFSMNSMVEELEKVYCSL